MALTSATMAECGLMQHRDIWRGIDPLAEHHGLTVPGQLVPADCPEM